MKYGKIIRQYVLESKNNFKEERGLKVLNNKNIIMLDIDGTIKDLVEENTDALIYTMKALNRVDIKLRGKLVLRLNKIITYFIKTGLLPTNSFMQYILLLIYSVLLLKSYSQFKTVYFKRYNEINIFFNGVNKKIEELYGKDKKIYLVTKNVQNRNILKCSDLNVISKLIISENKKSKYYMYNQIMTEFKLSKDSIVIVGDNLWDDVIPALVLGVNVIWCNMYSCKLKQIAIKILCVINKKVLSCDNINRI